MQGLAYAPHGALHAEEFDYVLQLPTLTVSLLCEPEAPNASLHILRETKDHNLSQRHLEGFRAEM